ncbi:putative ribonuclease H-like domain-containing protein [Tanacetum coccineum]
MCSGMNKAEIKTMSIDDLYNNFKIVEQKVTKSVGASSGAQNLAFMNAPSTSSTNDVNIVKPAYEVSTVSLNVNTASSQVSTVSFSDNVVYAFMIENPNGSNLLQQDLEQIHEDDLEAIDLKWRFSLLSMRAKRYNQRTSKKIFINANDTDGYDKSKVECFNCHKMGHCARECRAPRNKDGQFRNQDNTRKHGNNEDTSSKAMLVCGFEASNQCMDNMLLLYDLLLHVECDIGVIVYSCRQDLGFIPSGNVVLSSTYVGKILGADQLLVILCYRYQESGIGYWILSMTISGSGAHCKYYQRERMVYGNNYNRVNYNYSTNRTHPNAQRNMFPRVVLMKTGLKTFNTARIVNTAHPKSTVYSANPMSCFSKSAQSTVKRPFQPKIVLTNKRFTQKVNTAKAQAVNTARPKAVKTARPNSAVVNAVMGKPQQDDTGFVDSGCSRHMTRNIAYLLDFKEFDGGYVTFGGGAHGGRISGKGTLKTDSLDFEDLPDESQILLKIPRKDNMYNFDMKNIVPKESLTCLVAKATLDESMLWHRRLGHINFKNINKLVKDNLVRGLPKKHFENDQTCVACLKGKQHRASCKSKVLNPITKPLFMLHMDLFGPTFVSSLMHKKYCLVVTDDYSRFTWVFFLTTKDETSEILKNFIKEIENLVDKKVKIIRSDNRTEFKNKVMDDFCREKGIKREYSVARTPQQNGVAEKRNRTLIEATRTIGFKPALSFMRLFECHVTILNTLDNLGKFDGKSDEGFFVGYSLSSKAFRVYNTRTRRVEENLHIGFLENKHMIEGNGPKWLFNIDSLTQSMNYVPVAAGTITNESADASYFDSPSKDVGNGKPKSAADNQNHVEDGPDNENDEKDKYEDDSSPKEVNTAGQHVNTTSLEVNTGHFKLNTVDPSVNTASSSDPDSPKDMFTMGASHTLEATHVEFFSDEDEPEVDLGNILNSYTVPTTPNTRIHKDHPIKNVIGDVKSPIQTRRMTKPTSEQGIAKALSDSSWVEAMQEELLQFKLQQGHRQEEGTDYEEVFAPVARIETIRLFLAYASFMGFLVYQMDVKSSFLYGTIEEEVYVTQPP